MGMEGVLEMGSSECFVGTLFNYARLPGLSTKYISLQGLDARMYMADRPFKTL